MALADKANRYVDDKAPWVIAQARRRRRTASGRCSVGINLFRVLMAYLKPVMPELAERAEAFLGETLTWDGIAAPGRPHRRPFRRSSPASSRPRLTP